jgi:hypothetical protein
MLIIRAVAVGAKTVNEEFDATNTDVDGSGRTSKVGRVAKRSGILEEQS